MMSKPASELTIFCSLFIWTSFSRESSTSRWLIDVRTRHSTAIVNERLSLVCALRTYDCCNVIPFSYPNRFYRRILLHFQLNLVEKSFSTMSSHSQRCQRGPFGQRQPVSGWRGSGKQKWMTAISSAMRYASQDYSSISESELQMERVDSNCIVFVSRRGWSILTLCGRIDSAVETMHSGTAQKWCWMIRFGWYMLSTTHTDHIKHAHSNCIRLVAIWGGCATSSSSTGQPPTSTSFKLNFNSIAFHRVTLICGNVTMHHSEWFGLWLMANECAMLRCGCIRESALSLLWRASASSDDYNGVWNHRKIRDNNTLCCGWIKVLSQWHFPKLFGDRRAHTNTKRNPINIGFVGSVKVWCVSRATNFRTRCFVALATPMLMASLW